MSQPRPCSAHRDQFRGVFTLVDGRVAARRYVVPVRSFLDTCASAGCGARLESAMKVPVSELPSERDMAVIRLFMRVPHLTSRHVQELIFHNQASLTPCKRSLTRLSDLKYLDKSERRFIGGSRGGSSQWIYRLGRRGHFVLSDEPYQARRQPVEHSLATADCLVILRQLERLHGLPVACVLTEPDCHELLGGESLKPDMYVDLTHPVAGRLHLWLEIDMATQGRKRIMKKLGMYVSAYHHASDVDLERWPQLPRVLFVAVDDERMRELRWLINQLDEGDRGYFRVTTRNELPSILIS